MARSLRSGRRRGGSSRRDISASEPPRPRYRSGTPPNLGGEFAASERNVDVMKTIRAVCPHDCPDTCAMPVEVDETGRAVRVKGDPEHAYTHGGLCVKVAHYEKRTYHNDRLLHPMKGAGRKGDGRFERISWDEALDTISTKLKSIAADNPQSILPYSYAGTMGLLQGSSMDRRFFHRLGAS